MDDLEKFLQFLYRDTEGYVYVATKGPLVKETGTHPWNQEFFIWPDQKQAVYDYISLQGSQDNTDVYIAPAIYKAKNGLKRSVKGSNVVWVEFDGQEEIDFGDLPKPDCIIQTSGSTHLHCYWQVPFIHDIETLDGINRRLMYYLEADYSGFDASQVLRPPLSKNWKYGDAIEVVLAHFEPEAPHDFKDFDSAPEVEKPVIRLNSDQLEDPEKLIKELPLPASLKKKVLKETVAPDSQARSSFLMRVGYELAEAGCNHIQIVSLLSYVDDRVGKFKGRQDRLTRLSEIAARAQLVVEVEDGYTLYSPLEIVNYKDELEWLIPGWLHSAGFMILTGSPGVGKTTYGLQLLHELALANELLGRQITKPCRSLFLSLEMSMVELKFSFGHHYKAYAQDEAWEKLVRTTDYEGTLLDYESIIEEYKPHVVLLDSISELATDTLKEDESRAITRWIRRIRRRYNTAFIAIHHNRKDESSRSSSKRPKKLSDVYGSFIFGKDAETVINLERDEDEPEIVELYSLKTRFDRAFSTLLKQDSETLVFTETEKAVRVTDDDVSGPSSGPGRINLRFGPGS